MILFRAAISALVGAVLSAAPAFAALAPVYERQREIAQIIGDPDVARALRQQPIDAVDYVRADLYRVRAGDCTVEVKIVGDPLPKGLVGPRRFHIEVGSAMCR